MNSFWDLTRFEYKKILTRRSTLIVLAVTLLLLFFSCCFSLFGYVYVEGVPTETQLQALETDRGYSRALAGRTIDSELLLEMAGAYSKVPIDGQYTTTEEYALYGRPYSDLFRITRSVYSIPNNRFEAADLQKLTKEQADNFYEVRTDNLWVDINSIVAGNDAKSRLMELNSSVQKPLRYDYTDGYSRFFSFMYTTGIVGTFAVAILLAPLFSGEYASGADQLILSSRHGKGRLILAKLFTGVTLAGGVCLLLTALTYLQCMLLYGSGGADAAFQLFAPTSPYPLTIGQVALLLSLCVFMAILLFAAITMLLSSKMKSPFGVIVVTVILIIAPMFLSDPGKSVLVSNLFSMLPANMMAIWDVTAPRLFEMGGLMVKPYIFMPVFAAVAIVLTLPFTYSGFKKHQIG